MVAHLEEVAMLVDEVSLHVLMYCIDICDSHV